MSWTHVGDAFTDATLPSWAETGRRALGARHPLRRRPVPHVLRRHPDDGHRRARRQRGRHGDGPHPGRPVDRQRRARWSARDAAAAGDGNFLWTFDPTAVTDTDGSQWLFYGSYYGGLFTTRLNDDGTHGRSARRSRSPSTTSSRAPTSSAAAATGTCSPPPPTAAPARRRATACRSAARAACGGPYVDRQGAPLTRLARRRHAGADPERQPLGRRRAQRDRHRPGAARTGSPTTRSTGPTPTSTAPSGINQRPMLLDRLDWVGGWPARPRRSRARASGPSRRRSPAARRRHDVLRRRRRPALTTGRWTSGAADAQSGALPAVRPGRHRPHPVLRPRRRAGRGRPALRPARRTALVVSEPRQATPSGCVIDPTGRHGDAAPGRARAVLAHAPRCPPASTPPTGTPLSLERRGARRHRRAEQRPARRPAGRPADPPVLAAAARAGRAGALAAGAGVGVDNLSVAARRAPVTRLARRRTCPSRLDRGASDEFNGTALAPGWQWVRARRRATVGGGVLRWPTEAADLTGAGNDAGVLLRDPGPARGRRRPRSHRPRHRHGPQLPAGRARRLRRRRPVHPALARRDLEHPPDRVRQGDALRRRDCSYGGTIVGPPAATTWLRMTHRAGPPHRRAPAARLDQPGRLAPGSRAASGRCRRGRRSGRARLPRRRRRRPPTSTTSASTATDPARPHLTEQIRKADHDRQQRPERPLPPQLPGARRRGAAAAGLTACGGGKSAAEAAGGGTPSPPARSPRGYNGPAVTLSYWNGFTGGDGPFMKKMVGRLHEGQPEDQDHRQHGGVGAVLPADARRGHRRQGPRRRRHAPGPAGHQRRPQGHRAGRRPGQGARPDRVATSPRRCGRPASTRTRATASRWTCTRSAMYYNTDHIDEGRHRPPRPPTRRRSQPPSTS